MGPSTPVPHSAECIHVFCGLPSSRAVASLSLVDVPPPRSSLSLTHKPLDLRIKVSISDALFMTIIDKNDHCWSMYGYWGQPYD